MSEIKPEDMAEFKCHKVVRAVRIVNRILDRLQTIDGDTIVVPPGFITPQRELPGYLVRYEDGYLSWSPVKAFEEGYTAISPRVV